MLCSRLLKRTPRDSSPQSQEAGGKHAHGSKEGFFYRWMDTGYGKMLEWSLDHRGVTVLVALGTFALTFPLNQPVGRDFIPADDQSELNASIDTPVGTSLEGTAKLRPTWPQKDRTIRGVEFAWPTIVGQFSTKANIYIRLTDASQRKSTNVDIADEIRRKVMDLPQYRPLRRKVLLPSALGSAENLAPLRALVRGPDFYQVANIVKRAMAEMNKLPGMVDVAADFNLNSPELQIKIDRQRASDLGVRAPTSPAPCG